MTFRWAATLVAALALLAAPVAPLPAAGQTVPVAPPPTADFAPPSAAWPTPPPATAQAYLLIDADTGQPLAARAADDLRVVASTVKIITVLAALEVLDLDDVVTVGSEATVGGAGVGLDPGEQWTVQQLVDAVFVRSGNDAARALAAAADGDLDAFTVRMRDLADRLGLDGAVLDEPTGLDDANKLSARHLATAARVALDVPAIRTSASAAEVVLPDLGVVPNRNLLIGTYPGATGLKTGYTDLAGYCLVASAMREGRELVAVVLGSRGELDRFDEAAALLDHGFGRFAPLDTSAWQLRRPGGWERWDGSLARVWAPEGAETTVGLDVPVRLDGAAGSEAGDGDLSVTVAAAGERIVRVTATRPDVTDPVADGVGAQLAEALYAGLRQAHRAGAWEWARGVDAASGDLG